MKSEKLNGWRNFQIPTTCMVHYFSPNCGKIKEIKNVSFLFKKHQCDNRLSCSSEHYPTNIPMTGELLQIRIKWNEFMYIFGTCVV